MTARAFATAAALAAVLAGCGYKGPLTLPEKTGPVITRPAAAPTTPPAPTPEGTPTGG